MVELRRKLMKILAFTDTSAGEEGIICFLNVGIQSQCSINDIRFKS